MIVEQIKLKHGAPRALQISHLGGQTRKLAGKRFPDLSPGIFGIVKSVQDVLRDDADFKTLPTFRRYGSSVIPGGMGEETGRGNR